MKDRKSAERLKIRVPDLPEAEKAGIGSISALVVGPFVGSILAMFVAVGAGAMVFGALCALSGQPLGGRRARSNEELPRGPEAAVPPTRTTGKRDNRSRISRGVPYARTRTTRGSHRGVPGT